MRKNGITGKIPNAGRKSAITTEHQLVKVNLKISQEAVNILNEKPNKSAYVDGLIRKETNLL